MEICAEQAIVYLKANSQRVAPFSKDNTGKMWSYKIKGAKKSEFAFDPKTKGGLYVWFDRLLPEIDGLIDMMDIRKANSSTALDRVFSGGVHRAIFKATVKDIEGLERVISYLESL